MSESQKTSLSAEFYQTSRKNTPSSMIATIPIIYIFEDLAQLVGKTYHKKRNLTKRLRAILHPAGGAFERRQSRGRLPYLGRMEK